MCSTPYLRCWFKDKCIKVFNDLLDHVLQLLPTWGAGSRTNVSRFSMILLAMCSTLSLPEVLVRGQMCRGSPWPHWPCAPAPPYPAGDGLNIHHLTIQPLITRCWNSYIFVRSREKLELVSRKPEIPETFSKGLLPNKAYGNLVNTAWLYSVNTYKNSLYSVQEFCNGYHYRGTDNT